MMYPFARSKAFSRCVFTVVNNDWLNFNLYIPSD